MSEVIPNKTKMVRLRYTKPVSAYADLDLSDIDLSQVESVMLGRWSDLFITMKDGSIVKKDLWFEEENMLDWKSGFVLCGFLDEDHNTLRDFPTEEA
jgi:hypothetical protein